MKHQCPFYSKSVLLLGSLLMASTLQAQTTTTEVTEFNLAGPYAVNVPFAIDTVDIQGKKYDEEALLNAVSLSSNPTTKHKSGPLPKMDKGKSVGVLSFYVNNADYLKTKLKVEGMSHYKLYVDDTESSADLKLAPEHHTVAIRYLTCATDSDSVRVTFEADKPVPYTLDEQHPYMVHDLTDGLRVRGMSVSSAGTYYVMAFQNTERGGNSQWRYELREVKTGQLIRTLNKNVEWLPKSEEYIEEEWNAGKRHLMKTNVETGERTYFAYDIPKGHYVVSPTEDYLIVYTEEEGPKEDADVFEVVEMDDRQPGWRNRNYLNRYDIATGITQRITFGNKGEHLYDISGDGTRLLIGTSRSRLERRPTTVSDYYIVDARTLQVDTLLQGAEFVGGAHFSPDGKTILFEGTPEAFNRIGCQLPADVTPSMTENELFLYDLSSRQVRALTADFDPSVSSVDWSLSDGKIYFSAEDRDYVHLYRLDPQSGKIEMLPASGDYVYRWNMAKHAPVIGYLAYETMTPASAYVLNVKSKKLTRSFDGRQVIAHAQLGTCEDWNFVNSRGDTVYGRLYLPADFDASKRYPMIVYYYGGCSPVSRYFESPYAPQYWNSLGYVAYILQPSGATGFGQEWASRHVNTAGHGPADDIIEGVKKLCDTHIYINKEKIGCMGASYGGFMTQYLQTQTDIFAAAVSHAGIANHTSYWGEGYWGYNYSEVSMANSYPWSHRELYVDRSPLFNADKIHTPLLLLHGDADTNVPLIESLQMFTALKLLGREVALVEVKGENHHILDYRKREKWLATQMAWFQKWLKDDPTWWDALYPKKNL